MHILKRIRINTVAVFLCILSLLSHTNGLGEVLWAVNCGGDAHTDMHGIKYRKDPLVQTGVASDYGRNLIIQRVLPQDQILYQTERYHTSTFGYDIPLNGDGDYVIVMKFSEVWFYQPNQKVFDVQINNQHLVVEGLDIFAKVGRGVAHDELVTFKVKGNKLKVNGDSSPVSNNKVSVEFVKGDQDNPKINALYLMKGKLEDVPHLPPLPGVESKPPPEEEEEDEMEEETKKKRKIPQAHKVQDPYATDDTGSMMLPVFVAVGAFIPLLFCLCKL